MVRLIHYLFVLCVYTFYISMLLHRLLFLHYNFFAFLPWCIRMCSLLKNFLLVLLITLLITFTTRVDIFSFKVLWNLNYHRVPF